MAYVTIDELVQALEPLDVDVIRPGERAGRPPFVALAPRALQFGPGALYLSRELDVTVVVPLSPFDEQYPALEQLTVDVVRALAPLSPGVSDTIPITVDPDSQPPTMACTIDMAWPAVSVCDTPAPAPATTTTEQETDS